MADQIKSFCECGEGISAQLNAAGGLWQETWGKEACDWFDAEAAPNVGFLGNNVVGTLRTWATAAPEVDWSRMVVHLPLGGQLTLTALGTTESEGGAGQIIGDFQGVFVVDGLAAHAVVDEEAGTIKVPFGTVVEEGPDGLIEVTETSGKFKSICAVGSWEWYVNGTLTIARVATLPLQTNILAALANPSLVLGAEEKIVLVGSYYRSAVED